MRRPLLSSQKRPIRSVINNEKIRDQQEVRLKDILKLVKAKNCQNTKSEIYSHFKQTGLLCSAIIMPKRAKGFAHVRKNKIQQNNRKGRRRLRSLFIRERNVTLKMYKKSYISTQKFTCTAISKNSLFHSCTIFYGTYML